MTYGFIFMVTTESNSKIRLMPTSAIRLTKSRKKLPITNSVDCSTAFAQTDATATTAELSVNHFQKTGKIPSRRELIEQYYGEYIEKADIFIGFEKFNVFDYPMLGWGEESLYFTAAPSLYLSRSSI